MAVVVLIIVVGFLHARLNPEVDIMASKSKKPSPKTGLLLEFSGVADGTRTHDDRNHNPGLYQLSYSHH